MAFRKPKERLAIELEIQNDTDDELKHRIGEGIVRVIAGVLAAAGAAALYRKGFHLDDEDENENEDENL